MKKVSLTDPPIFYRRSGNPPGTAPVGAPRTDPSTHPSPSRCGDSDRRSAHRQARGKQVSRARDSVRVVLADDHPLICQAMEDYLARSPDLQVVAVLADGTDLERTIQEERPDLLILDLNLEPGFRPAQAVGRLREIHRGLKVLVLSAHNEPRWVIEMLEAGIDAYVHKSEPLHNLLPVIQQVLDGDTWYSHCLLQQVASECWHDKSLASHEKMVLQTIANGGNLTKLAGELGVSERTLTRYLGSAMEKLGVQSRLEAVVAAMRRGLIE